MAQPKQPDWGRLSSVVLLRPAVSAGEPASQSADIPFHSLVPNGQGKYAKTLLVFVRNFA